MNIFRHFKNIVIVFSGPTASLWFSKCARGKFGTATFFTYKDLTDALFYMPGVARHTLTSLWTPNSRYFEITEDGFVADDVIPGTITIDNIDSQCVSRLKTASLATKCEPALQIIENM